METKEFLDSEIATRPDFVALMSACQIQDDCQGASGVMSSAVSLLDAAQRFGEPALAAWASVARAAAAELRRIQLFDLNAGNLLTLCPDARSLISKRLFRWEALGAGIGAQASALVGRAIAVAAETKQPLSAALLTGAQILGHLGRARSQDWQRVAEAQLLDQVSVRNLLAQLPAGSPAREFLVSAQQVLETRLAGPAKPTASNAPSDEPAPAKRAAKQDLQVPAPSVGAHLKEASLTSFQAKLGLPNRDSPGVDDLRPVATAFRRALESGDPAQVALGLLGCCVIVVGFADVQALKLPIDPPVDPADDQSIYLSSAAGCTVWDAAALLSMPPGRHVRSYSPLPAAAAGALRNGLVVFGPSRTLGELLCAMAHTEQTQLLAKFRDLVSEHSDPVLKMYRGRLANAYAQCTLDTHQSDMTTAALCLQFAAVAPAACNYYAPRYSTLFERAEAVMEAVGLGPPAPLPADLNRWGSARVLEVDQAQQGWSALVRALNEARERALSESLDPLPHSNRWLLLCAAAFVVRTGHRCQRINDLTCSALLLSEDFGVILDKAETTDRPSGALQAADAANEVSPTSADKERELRAQPRLIGFDAVVQASIASAVECRVRMTALGAPFGDADGPLFISATQTGECDSLVTADVAAIIQQYFGDVPANFARAQWVTCLDEDKVDRWLTRHLTGHARDLTRTADIYFNVAPARRARQLANAMQATGERVFGSAAPS